MKPAAGVSAIFLGFIGLAHLVRVLFQVEIVVHGVTIPMWGSLFAALFVSALAIWLWREGGATAQGV